MTPNTITLKDGKLIAFEAPEKPDYYKVWELNKTYSTSEFLIDLKVYEQALQAAIDNGVEFKPDQIETVKKILYQKGVCFIMEQGNHYPVPDGYEIKREQSCPNVCDCRDDTTGHIKCKSEYAILVPKQNVHKTCNEWPDCDCGQLEKDNCTKELILVPKQKDIDHEFRDSLEKNFDRLIDGLPKQDPVNPNDGFDIQQGKLAEKFWSNIEKSYPVKQPTSIEEAAVEYSKNNPSFKSSISGQIEDAFIAGTKSQLVEDILRKAFIVGWKEGKFFMQNYGSLLGDDVKAIKEQIEEDWENWFEQFKQEKK